MSASGSDVWVSTGNECDPTVNTCPPGDKIGHSLSIAHLSGSLKLLQAWRAPGTAGHGHDWDFGSSPTLFGSGTGTPPRIGACDKDGRYYALAANPLGGAPIWTDRVGAPSANISIRIDSAVWDGPAGHMFIGGNTTTIRGASHGGSVREVDPATGGYLWQAGLPCAVLGTPTLDSSGVLAAGTYTCPTGATPGAYLINAATGAILHPLPVSASPVFAQPVFAQDSLFVATTTSGLYDFAP